MASCREAYRRLADCIHDVCSPFGDVLDIGCGLGFVGFRLAELGHIFSGRDLWSPNMLHVDLRYPFREEPRELVICTETAEHIAEEYADTVVQNVCDHARNRIVWSAARPGQEGVDHVNLKSPFWWLDKFRAEGWESNPFKTSNLRFLMEQTKAQHMYCKDNFFVLERT